MGKSKILEKLYTSSIFGNTPNGTQATFGYCCVYNYTIHCGKHEYRLEDVGDEHSFHAADSRIKRAHQSWNVS